MTEKGRILIVDDDESTRKSLKLILNRTGYLTETAGSGHEALERAQDGLFNNLALLDIWLPDMETYHYQMKFQHYLGSKEKL